MELNLIFSIIWIILSLGAFIYYYYSILKWDTKPHIYTWLIFTISLGTAFYSTNTNRGRIWIVCNPYGIFWMLYSLSSWIKVWWKKYYKIRYSLFYLSTYSSTALSQFQTSNNFNYTYNTCRSPCYYSNI